MKKIGIVFILLLCYSSFQAQHKISAYAGWTVSQLQTYLKPEFKKGKAYDNMYNFPPMHSPYFCLEYEYDWKLLRFSTGLSFTMFGTSGSFADSPWGTSYLNIPIIVGVNWKLPKNFGLTLETGFEFGAETGSDLYFYRYKDMFLGNINAIVGLEASWKQFRFGTRLQIGLTTFREMGGNREVILRHSGITTYVGYTLWDSQRAKERKAKRLAEKNAKG